MEEYDKINAVSFGKTRFRIYSKLDPAVDNIFIDVAVNEYEMVDLGLPSGLKWAREPMRPGTEMNLESSFWKLAWGELSPEYYQPWRYISNSKYVIDPKRADYKGKWRLEPEDDAATVWLGEGWRIPRERDFVELLEYCNVEGPNFYNDSGFYAYKISSKVSGHEHDFIYFPGNLHFDNKYNEAPGRTVKGPSEPADFSWSRSECRFSASTSGEYVITAMSPDGRVQTSIKINVLK